ncbi:MAG TPA: hypothetical protein VEJ44_05270 [Acidimicrobiales bacterium]|nr:hypothetical protein [Acidimicrobiales bacterium]
MPFMTWINTHRLLVSGFGVVVLLLTAVAGVWFFLLRSSGTQIDLRQALRLYREGQRGAAGAAGRGLPAPGVYRYRTSGGERLSLAGISRSFPAASNLVVTDGTCSSMNWVPLEQHTEGIEVCRQPNGALTMAQASSVESIAGVSTSQVVHCSSTAYFIPPDPRAGERWFGVCHGPGQVDKVTGEVIGLTTVTVHGQRLPALHTRIDTSVSGAEKGTDPTDYWVSPETGLILRQRESASVSQQVGPLGSVHYTEVMAISMSSLSPVR